MIYGQSAGAISTSMHTIYQPSADMINSVVVHSNPYAIPMKENWEAKKQFAEFEEKAGCAGKAMVTQNLKYFQKICNPQ